MICPIGVFDLTGGPETHIKYQKSNIQRFKCFGRPNTPTSQRWENHKKTEHIKMKELTLSPSSLSPPLPTSSLPPAVWHHTVNILEFTSFLATLHWLEGAVDLGKCGISFLELLIMFGQRLACEKKLLAPTSEHAEPWLAPVPRLALVMRSGGSACSS